MLIYDNNGAHIFFRVQHRRGSAGPFEDFSISEDVYVTCSENLPLLSLPVSDTLECGKPQKSYHLGIVFTSHYDHVGDGLLLYRIISYV